MQSRLWSLFTLSWVCVFLLLAGCARSGGIEDGLYLRQSLGLNGSGGPSTILFGPEERIVMNPEGGVDPFDASKTDPSRVGTYKFDGKDTVTIQWGGAAAPQTRRVEFQHGKLSGFDSGVMTKAESYSRNQTLDASYSGSSDLFANAAGSVAGSREITFSKDGNFTLGATGVATSARANSVSTKNEQGTYTFSGNTLTLTFADGRVSKHTVLPFNSALDPSHAKLGDEKILFDRMFLSRVK